MSSDYRLICLNHDPAIVIYEPEWQNDPAGAAYAVRNRADIEALAPHLLCDLVVGRYSYPLIEVGCVSHDWHGPDGLWIDAKWMRLVLAAHRWGGADLGPLATAAASCWTADRIDRLFSELGMSVDGWTLTIDPVVRRIGDRLGQLAFTLVICGIAGWGAFALVSRIPVEWAQISVGAIAALMWLLLVSTGISAALAKTKKP